jgi:hypothetical protein
MEEELAGPYLTIAVLCEKVLQEKDGVLSAIRIISQMNIVGPTDEMLPTPLALTALVSFTAGFVTGKYIVRIRPISPSHHEMGGAQTPAFFEGQDRGVNLVFNLGLVLREEGIFWFEVLLQDKLVTRIPLRVLYQKAGPGFPPMQ